MHGLLVGKRLDAGTAIFLITTVATNVTGFGFPFHKLLPSHAIGGISLVVLAIAIIARYARHLVGPWRRVYVISALIALYFNVFVFIVQLPSCSCGGHGAFCRARNLCSKGLSQCPGPHGLKIGGIPVTAKK